MELQRFQRVDEFSHRAERFLLAHEAEHNLILGLCMSTVQQSGRLDRQPYLATVSQQGAVVAAAVMTPPMNLILSRVEMPEALPLIAQNLYHQHPALPGVMAAPGTVQHFAMRWQALSGQRYRLRTAERIYQLDGVTAVQGVPGMLRRADDADRDLLLAWLVAFYAEADRQPDERQARIAAERNVASRLHSPTSGYYLWVDGAPVSLAGCTGATPHGIRIAPVFTPPEQRRRGYASAVVAALSQSLLDRGYRRCYLFTDLGNPTANKIYQTIGYRPVCDVDEYTFTPAYASS
jgi:predicted GNAT family acetyltransferase